MKVLAVYPGRFQPFHKGHAQVYQWLKNKFGGAVVATSNKVDPPKSPFNFQEKKMMMRLAGVRAGDVQEVVNPYIAKEILRNYDPKTTVLVFAVSQKDMEEDPRFSFKPTKSGKPGYLQPYAGNEKKLKPFGDPDKPTGYVIVTPTFQFDVLGEPMKSASEFRANFMKADKKTQKAMITDLYGRYDEKVHTLMASKIKKGKTLKEMREVNIGMTLSRSLMPQVGASASFVKYLKDNSIESVKQPISPNNLKSSQMEFDFNKVESMRSQKSDNPIVVSNDDYVLDGHHRWLADKMEGRNCTAYRVNLPILELMRVAKEYENKQNGVLSEELTHKKFGSMLDAFVSFASDKLGLKSLPSVRYKNEDDEYNSFAAYNPSSNELSISTKNRHPMDVFRSVAHELVHHKQNEDGRLGKDIAKEGATGSDIENEANSEAGKIMRWFAKEQPHHFKLGSIVESTNAAAIGGVRGLGNVTGEVSPTDVPQYVLDNQNYTAMLQDNNTTGLWDFSDNNWWMNSDDMKKYQAKTFKALRSKMQLQEGINDPGIFKAVFLAGGPGSGKDYILKKTIEGNGLTEINSDTALEFLMTKNGLDFKMPEEERGQRDIARGRAKNITKEKQRLAILGRKGVIINGTADDPVKIATIKAQLEELGYDSMMVFVNTSDEVSKKRNIERGKGGGREVPEDIRKEKWEAVQKARPEMEKLFGKDRFVAIDNSEDLRKAPKATVDRMEKVFLDTFKKVRDFSSKMPLNPIASGWVDKELERQNIQGYIPPKASTSYGTQKAMPYTPPATQSVMDKAKAMGLQYYGFGRFGKNHQVTHIEQGAQLVAKPQNIKEENVSEDLRKWFNQKWVRFDTKGNIKGDCAREPGEGKPKCRPLASAVAMGKEARAKAARRKRREDPVANRKGKGGKPVFVKTEAASWAQQAAIAIAKKKSGKYNKEGERIREEVLNEKNVPTNPQLWSRAKALARSKFDVYPSAYANGWASKWYKSKGGGWRSSGVDEAFENFIKENSPSDREWGTTSLANIYKEGTPGQSEMKKKLLKKKLKKEDNSIALGYNFGNSGIGQEFGVVRSPNGLGFGYSIPMGGAVNMAESIVKWMNNPNTQQKFIEKYGNLAEQKLIEAANKLQEAGCGVEMSTPKSVKKIKESIKEPAEMGMIGVQRKDEVSESSKEDVIDTSKIKSLKRYKKEIHPQSEFEKKTFKEEVSVQDIAKRNKINNLNLIKIGQELDVNGKKHIVKKGETLSSISKKYSNTQTDTQKKEPSNIPGVPPYKPSGQKPSSAAEMGMFMSKTPTPAPDVDLTNRNLAKIAKDDEKKLQRAKEQNIEAQRKLNAQGNANAPIGSMPGSAPKPSKVSEPDKASSGGPAVVTPKEPYTPSQALKNRIIGAKVAKLDFSGVPDTELGKQHKADITKKTIDFEKQNIESKKRQKEKFENEIQAAKQKEIEKQQTAAGQTQRFPSKREDETSSSGLKFNKFGVPDVRDVASKIGSSVLDFEKNYLDPVRRKLGAKTSIDEETPAWQRKEGKDPEGGLNRKGIASYRRANPGSKLSMAVTTEPSKLKKGSKSAKRRLSFCRRMKGMKAKLTSAKTARDPDSRINKSLRKWNCEE